MKMGKSKKFALNKVLATVLLIVSLFLLVGNIANADANFTPIGNSIIENNVEAEEFELNDDFEYEEHLTIYFFWGKGCPYCEQQKIFLDKIKNEYPEIEIKDYEVWYNRDNQELMDEIAKEFNVRVTGVPITFIGDEYWIGFSDAIGNEMIEAIESCIRECVVDEEELAQKEKTIINLPLFGEVDFSTTPLIFPTALIAFVDGFNPCSLWVLTFLLGIVIYSGSKKKILAVGLTYLLITAGVYGIFIAGLLNIFMYVGFLDWIRYTVVTIALIFALVNIKDFFWYKKGISFTISDKYKPKLFKKIRGIMHPNNSIPAMIGATALMALGITLVELPCTAGFPVIWSNLVAAQNLNTSSYIMLLLVYLLIYLSVELVIFFGAVFAMKQSKFEQKHGRLLKLIGGMIMLALAIMLAVDPKAMEDFGITFTVFGGAILASIIIYRLYVKIMGEDALEGNQPAEVKTKKQDSKNKLSEDEINSNEKDKKPNLENKHEKDKKIDSSSEDKGDNDE